MNNTKEVFSEQEIEKIKKNGFTLLKKHNNVKQKTKRRLINKDDEGFLSGCKGNVNYRFQKKLTVKQLRRMKGISDDHKESEDKLNTKYKQVPPKSLFKETPTKIEKRKLSPKQQKLKDIILKIK